MGIAHLKSKAGNAPPYDYDRPIPIVDEGRMEDYDFEVQAYGARPACPVLHTPCAPAGFRIN